MEKPHFYIRFAFIVLLLAVIACSSENMRMRDLPVVECATPSPEPTSTVLPGTPIPTSQPDPTPVPHLTDFPLGNNVRIGGLGGIGLGILVNVDNVEVHGPFPRWDQQSGEETEWFVTAWDVTIQNRSTNSVYEFYPFAQFYVLDVVEDNGDVLRGAWSVSAEAHTDIDLPTLELSEEQTQLEPGTSTTIRVAAYVPTDKPYRFAYILDPFDTESVEEMVEANSLGSNVGVWINAENPDCGNSLYVTPTPTPEGGGGQPPIGTGEGMLARPPVSYPGLITRGFGCAKYYTGFSSPSCSGSKPWFHNGVDFASRERKVIGDPIWDVLDVPSQVIFSGADVNGDCSHYQYSDPPHFGFGNYLKQSASVSYEGRTYNLVIYYAHLSRFIVTQGDSITPGQQIADMGSTGCSTGAHLHFSVKANGFWIDPCLNGAC